MFMSTPSDFFEEGGAERRAIAPHVELAREALDHVDARKALEGQGVVAGRQVDPHWSAMGIDLGLRACPETTFTISDGGGGHLAPVLVVNV